MVRSFWLQNASKIVDCSRQTVRKRYRWFPGKFISCELNVRPALLRIILRQWPVFSSRLRPGLLDHLCCQFPHREFSRIAKIHRAREIRP